MRLSCTQVSRFFRIHKSHRRALLGASAAAAACLWLFSRISSRRLRTRVFPATFGIDDPGVNDEFSPTLTYLPSNSGGAQEFDAEFSWSKTIIPNVGMVISDGAT